MTEPEEVARQKEQERALDVFRPSGGAMIRHTPLDRVQEVIAVNRSDLENIRDFDNAGAFGSAVGTFFLSGGLWLGVDKYYSWQSGPVPTVLVICMGASIIGFIFIGFSMFFGRKKRGYINRIFAEVKSSN